VNTSPIIALSSIGYLYLLKDLYGDIIIPTAVYEEIGAKADSKAKYEVEASLGWISIVPIKNTIAKALYKSQLHDGEVEVMILGKELDADLIIIDDKNAKKHAKYLGFKMTGTLGVLIAAKEAGLISNLKPLLDELIINNIYLDHRIVEYCLKRAGE
jgi:predicted nucleic acid-binding protein